MECIAAGVLDGGDSYNNKSNSMLRIQGRYAAVGNLSCLILWYNHIYCSWSPPFSLTPIPQYIITQTSNTSQLVVTDTTVFINWSYPLHFYGDYTIDIAGNSTAGKGESSTRIVNTEPQGTGVELYKITNYIIIYRQYH